MDWGGDPWNGLGGGTNDERNGQLWLNLELYRSRDGTRLWNQPIEIEGATNVAQLREKLKDQANGVATAVERDLEQRARNLVEPDPLVEGMPVKDEPGPRQAEGPATKGSHRDSRWLLQVRGGALFGDVDRMVHYSEYASEILSETLVAGANPYLEFDAGLKAKERLLFSLSIGLSLAERFVGDPTNLIDRSLREAFLVHGTATLLLKPPPLGIMGLIRVQNRFARGFMVNDVVCPASYNLTPFMGLGLQIMENRRRSLVLEVAFGYPIAGSAIEAYNDPEHWARPMQERYIMSVSVAYRFSL